MSDKKAYFKAYREKNKAKLKAYKDDWLNNKPYNYNRDYSKVYYLNNKEAWKNKYLSNKIAILETKRLDRLGRLEIYKSRDANRDKGYSRAKAAKRNAYKLQATPEWLTEQQQLEIVSIYRNCPEGYEVDHIVPLQGKTVRGLHVPWNLQYLTKEQNRLKSNKL